MFLLPRSNLGRPQDQDCLEVSINSSAAGKPFHESSQLEQDPVDADGTFEDTKRSPHSPTKCHSEADRRTFKKIRSENGKRWKHKAFNIGTGWSLP